MFVCQAGRNSRVHCNMIQYSLISVFRSAARGTAHGNVADTRNPGKVSVHVHILVMFLKQRVTYMQPIDCWHEARNFIRKWAFGV
jgi:hypothetical protein